MIRSVAFALVFLTAIGFFACSCLRLIRTLKIGKKEDRSDQVGRRIRNVLTVAFGQSKLLRDPLPGTMHFLIFWGFVILLSAVLEAILEGLFPGFRLETLGAIFPPLAVLQEVVGLLVVISVILGLVRWYLVPPKRYYGPEVSVHVRLDATLILLTILLIIVSMFGTNATGLLITGSQSDVRFVSLHFAALFRGSPQLPIWHEIFWWVHILLVLGFLNYLPNSKHLHVLTSVPNVFFASLKPRGALSKLNLEDEGAEKFGVSDITDLTWKSLLDGYTCTDCGRCTASCPANFTGKALSPRKIIMNIRQRTAGLSPLLQTGTTDQNKEIADRMLLDGYITEDELWACTTCQACMQECPVMIEHVPVIIDMRRYLVLTESRFPTELTTTFKNMENNFTPWAFSHETRADWAKGLDVKVMAEAGDDVDVLYWVGCAGSYDKRYEKVSRAMVQLMNAAGINFAILGTEEKCNGDAARRAGNEYLAQILMSENVETLNRYKFKRIVATCPHCFNTIKNEYPQFGGNYEVVHHTQFLEELVRTGRLKLAKESAARTTFHDSCYLGRYNSIYEAPRNLLRTAAADLVEMPRSKDRGFCCGAGGARMFMEENVGKRVNVERTEEALSLKPETIATACPFCMTMLTDGLKARDAEEQTQIKDVAEVLAAAIIEPHRES